MRKSFGRKVVSFVLLTSMLAASTLGVIFTGPVTVKAQTEQAETKEDQTIPPEEIPSSEIIPEIEETIPPVTEAATVTEEVTEPTAKTVAVNDVLQVSPATMPADAIFDVWENNASQAAEINKVLDGDVWRQIRSGNGHSNTALDNNVFLIENDTNTNIQAGYFEAIIKPISAAANTRMGFVVRYNEEPKTGVFIGYDPGGKWYWQLYITSTNQPYGYFTAPAPASGKETKVRLDFTGENAETNKNHKMTLTIDGQAAGTIDISELPDAGKLGVRLVSGSDILFREVHYTGQADVPAQTVSGTIVASGSAINSQAAANTPITGADVALAGQTAKSATEGAFSFTVRDSKTYHLSVNADGYEEYTGKSVPVSGSAVTLGEIGLTKENSAAVALETTDMTVRVDPNFPRVIDYTMKTTKDVGKVFYGHGTYLIQLP